MLISDMKDTKWIDESAGQDLLEYMEYLSSTSAYLSLLFRYPTEEVYKSVKEYYSEFQSLTDDEYGVNFSDLPEKDIMEIEYVRLFQASLHGVVAPLYSSVYTSEERLVLRDSTLELKDMMLECGFSLRDDIKEIEDNLYVMLEFLSVLLKRMSEGDADSMPYAFRVIQDYIMPMKGEFCKKLEEGARLPFYRSLSQFFSLFSEELSEFCDFFCDKNI